MSTQASSEPTTVTKPTAAKPMLDGERPRFERVLVGGFTMIPMAALVAAVPLAWGWGLGWTDIGLAIGFGMYSLSFVATGMVVCVLWFMEYVQSSLPKDPAGRLAKVTEMMQAQIITLQEGRRLLDYPDLEQVEKLANAAEERILQILDDIVESGKYTPPDPFIDLDLATKLSTQYINLYSSAKLEESKASKLRDFFNQVQTIKQAAVQPPMPGAPTQPGGPQAVPAPPPVSDVLPNGPQQAPQAS